jgi:hypothetical protein
MSWEDFEEAKATAQVEGGGAMNVHSTRRIACDSKVMRVVLGGRLRNPRHWTVG